MSPKCFKKAIDELPDDGVLFLQDGTYPLAGRIVFKENMTFKLSDNAILLNCSQDKNPMMAYNHPYKHNKAEGNSNIIIEGGIWDQLMFRADEETKTLRFPFDFEFTSVFTLDGHTLHHEVHVKNCGDENMRCGIGFHPGFNIPFDENHTTTDYEIRFEQEESPIILDCLPHGLLSGKSFYQWKNTQAIPLTDTLFDNDSFCLAGLRSKTIGIYEKNSERKIICDISEYPYTLLWSAPTKPMRFICIEPWQSLPAAETDTSEWNEHAAAACIAPNESYSITLHTTFER